MTLYPAAAASLVCFFEIAALLAPVSCQAQTLATLANFNGANGAVPEAALLLATDGNFYGTTEIGGANNSGTVFKITSGGALTKLYSFSGGADGGQPSAGLMQAFDGKFYGTTANGGANGFGTVFKITPGGTLTTLYSFGPYPNGWSPRAGLIQASDGNFYGTTQLGGANNRGTVFKITPGGALTTLYSFCSRVGCADGGSPRAGLKQASDGNFYGTTSAGGASSNAGTVFKITAEGMLTTLYSFCAQAGCNDGEEPVAGLVQAADGNLYGTTYGGGSNNDGAIFKLATESSAARPAINQSGGVVSGASFQAGIAPGSWITIFGTNLSSITDTWADANVNSGLPTSLYGVSVSVGGEPAYVYSISSTQINALAPNVSTGTVPVTVTNSGETSSAVNVAVQPVEPAFFQWGNYAVATRQDYSSAVKNGTFPGVTTMPAKPGDVVILWGTGFGPTNPSAPVGGETPSLTIYTTASPVTVTVGGLPATVYGTALAAGYAGLYQVTIQIPTSLANGDYAIIATASGAQSPSTTLITVQN